MKNEMNMFEVAVRNKMRFPFKGLISVEDLFDLSTKDLDSIFKTLNSQLKQSQEESLLEVKTEQDKELDTKIEIIKYIVQVKLDEEKVRMKTKENKEKKQKIMELMAKKQDESLQNMSMEDLQKMYNELED